MKYLQNGGYQNNPYMRMTILFALVFLAGFVATNFMLYFSKMDLTATSVVSYYSGSEAEFRPARSYQSMLEVTHGHLPMMALVLLLLTHLVILAPLSGRLKATFVIVPFVSGLVSEASGWLVRFAGPEFALLKVVSFLTLQASLVLLLVVLGLGILSSRAISPPGGNGSQERSDPERQQRNRRESHTAKAKHRAFDAQR